MSDAPCSKGIALEQMVEPHIVWFRRQEDSSQSWFKASTQLIQDGLRRRGHDILGAQRHIPIDRVSVTGGANSRCLNGVVEIADAGKISKVVADPVGDTSNRAEAARSRRTLVRVKAPSNRRVNSVGADEYGPRVSASVLEMYRDASAAFAERKSLAAQS
jgi:hypothetical protein